MKRQSKKRRKTAEVGHVAHSEPVALPRGLDLSLKVLDAFDRVPDEKKGATLAALKAWVQSGAHGPVTGAAT